MFKPYIRFVLISNPTAMCVSYRKLSPNQKPCLISTFQCVPCHGASVIVSKTKHQRSDAHPPNTKFNEFGLINSPCVPDTVHPGPLRMVEWITFFSPSEKRTCATRGVHSISDAHTTKPTPPPTTTHWRCCAAFVAAAHVNRTGQFSNWETNEITGTVQRAERVDGPVHQAE